VKRAKLKIIPSVIPSGLCRPFPLSVEERTMGNNGQMHGARIVTNPERNAKPSKSIILGSSNYSCYNLSMKYVNGVDEYIANAPKEIQSKLNELRKTIKLAAPKATEKISYGMPFYDYKGRLVYFGVAKNHIGLYIPPPIIENHKEELKNYGTTKSAVHLSLDKELPLKLVTKLVKARLTFLE